MLIHQIQFQAFVHNVDSTSINGQTVTIHPQETLSVESSFQHHFTLSQSHSIPTHFHFCCCWRYTRVQHKFLFPERFFGAISNPTATGPSRPPLTPIVSLILCIFFFFRNRTLWSHSPARWFVCSSLSLVQHQHSIKTLPPFLPLSLLSWVSLCSALRALGVADLQQTLLNKWSRRVNLPDSFRGRTDGPDTCCRLVRPGKFILFLERN